MTGLVRKAMLLTAAGCLIASVAAAGVPSAANSTVPGWINAMGAKAGVPDPHGQVTIVVRDLANNPLNGASVVIDLSGCADLNLCCDQLDAGTTVNCPAKTTRKFTDVTGTVQFILEGKSIGSGNAVELQGAGRVYANGTLIGSPTVPAFDLDGSSGVGINDLSVWLGDFGTLGNPAFGRADFDHNGAVGINDLSVWLTQFGFSTSIPSVCSP
jgi:hypothetical protein